MRPAHLSLKWLEVLQRVARLGSLQIVTKEAGLSVSTVSHHLRALENAMGVSLVDHTKRPMVLTAQGTMMLPFPGHFLARYVSINASDAYNRRRVQLLDTTLRQLIRPDR